ncbi:UPF0235 protein C15orf40 homolog [Apostichopus japonicus]|uniref:UPF0235 protein C15orf40 homolog n=1 Tax=Stichopus japonicus TaxID=307972 RepID=UPI003AB8CD19
MKTVCRLYQYRWISHIAHRSQSTRVSSNMPKKKGKSGNDSSQKQPVVVDELHDPIQEKKNGTFSISVHAKPGSKQNAVTEITSEAISVQVSAPAMEGEANVELGKYIASIVGVRKSDVSLTKGMRSRSKVFSVTACGLTVDQLLDAFKTELEAG